MASFSFDREATVYLAKLANQAGRHDGKTKGDLSGQRLLRTFGTGQTVELELNEKKAGRHGEASVDESIKPGSIVSGVVKSITPLTMVVGVNGARGMKWTIFLEHLADHHGLATSTMSVMKLGYHFDKLLVLDIEGNNLILTANYSLVNLNKQLSLDVSQINCHSVVHSGIWDVLQATSDRRLDLSKVFYIGQSVRSNIVDVASDTGRITLSLKQSLCCSNDASFIQEYFVLEEKYLCHCNGSSSSCDWWEVAAASQMFK
ncbi:hypothetical protein ACS0TY_017863 [Phlomoides rotata]